MFALFIDGLQAMLSLALLGVVTGISLIPGAVFVAQPVGLVLGAVISLCLSITMGGALMVALALNGMFFWNKVIPAFAELIPGISNGPVWTFVVIRCMWQHARENKSTRKGIGVLKLATASLPAVQKITRIKTAANNMRVRRAAPQAGQIPESGKDLVRIALTQRPAFDGIKPLPPRTTQTNVKTA